MKFSEVNTSQSRWLLLDASFPQCLCGVLKGDGQWIAVHKGQTGALKDLHNGIRLCLEQAGILLEDVSGFLYCEGPGSILGLRLAAMMLRTWRSIPSLSAKPLFAWRSGPLAAEIHGGKDVLVASISRQGCWCIWDREGGWREVKTEALQAFRERDCLLLPQRKSWEPPPAFFKTISENPLLPHPNQLLNDRLLCPMETPDVFVVRPAGYQTWKSPFPTTHE